MPGARSRRSYVRPFERWRKAYAAAAERDRYAWILEQHGFDPAAEDAPEQGEALVDALAGAVEMVVAEQCLPGMCRPDFEWFLAWQRYGQEPRAGYSVRYGPTDIELFVDDLRVLDLEELCDSAFYVCVRVLHADGKITKSVAKALIRHVEHDMNFGGGEYRFQSEQNGAEVMMEIFR